MAVVSIIIGGREAKIRSPFQAKDLIREMPVRSWDPDGKCWVIPASDVPVLQVVLEQAGYRVIVTQDVQGHEQEREQWRRDREKWKRDRERWDRERAQRRRQDPPPRSSRGATGSWAEQMFIALSPELAEKAFKALTRALHPDVGGSTEQMQLLNAARTRYGRRS